MMGKTGIQSSRVYLHFAVPVVIVFLIAVSVSCGGGSGKSTPANTGTLALTTSDGGDGSKLTFNYMIDDTVKPSPVTLNVKSTSGSDVDFSATTDVANPNWLSVLPNNGTTPGTITVTPLPSNLGKGVYTGHVIVTGPGSRVTSTVVLTVQSTTKPILDVSPTSLSFTAVQGGSDPPANLFSVKNDNPTSDPSQMQFSLSTDSAWLEASSQSNVSTTSVTVQPHVGSLAQGTYTGKVTVTAPDAVTTTATVNVTFTVTAPQ
jgi:hypothetical protein